MTILISTLISLAPAFAGEVPASEAASRIEAAYNPKIEVQKTGSSLSLYGCLIEEFRILGKDPITIQERTVTLSLYRARKKNQRAVLILPPTGGVNILDQGYANELCSGGITAAIVSGWDHQGESSLDFDMHNKGALRALAASRHAVEFLRRNDFHSIGLLGTSIGAVAGVLTLSFEPVISSATLIVGGARFADLVAESDEAGADKLRKSRMREMGFKDVEAYKQALREHIWIEPIQHINRLGKKEVFLISADADTTVPTEQQMELAQILEARKHLRLRGNHLQAIKDAFWWNRGKIARFFQQTLSASAKPSLAGNPRRN